MAEQLIKAFVDFDDFIGSSHDKHIRHYKYYQVLMEALKDPSALIYPPTRPTNNKRVDQNDDSSDEGNEKNG